MYESHLLSELINRRTDLVRAIARRDPDWARIAADVEHLSARLADARFRAAADGDGFGIGRAIGW